MRHYIVRLLSFALTAGGVAFGSTDTNNSSEAEDLLSRSGVKGGLVVVVGCPSPGSGQASLDSMLKAADRPGAIQFVDTTEEQIDEARKAIQAAGLCGRVSAVPFDGQHLPYIDNLVNLLVSFGEERLSASAVLALAREIASNSVSE